MKTRLLANAFAVAACAAPAAGQALVIGECEVTATSILFGAYNPASATALTSTGDVTVSCRLAGLLQSWTILLSQGGGSYAVRRMASGANTLDYNIYTTSGHAQIWGNGTAGTVTVADSISLFVGVYSESYTTYGRIPALQDVAPGAYTDSIIVTINY